MHNGTKIVIGLDLQMGKLFQDFVKQRLKIWIRASGGTRRISEAASISFGTLNKNLHGSAKPSFETVARISRICGFSIDQLVREALSEENLERGLSDAPIEEELPTIKAALQGKGINPASLTAAVANVLDTLEENDSLFISGSISREQLAGAIAKSYLNIEKYV